MEAHRKFNPEHTLFFCTRHTGKASLIKSYLKKVFSPNLCVRPSFQVLDILEYACGLKLGPALTLS
jgi:hypothetical protein